MLEKPPGTKHFVDSLLSITNNDQRGGAQGGAVRTTGLQEQARPTAAVTAEATTGEAMTQVGTAAKTATRPVVATSEAAGTPVGAPATPTAEGRPQEGTDLDRSVLAFLDEE